MPADDDVAAAQRTDELGAHRRLKILTELRATVGHEAADTRERLHGLDAATVGAREDRFDLVGREQLDERVRLPASAFVERPVTIVAAPRLAVACGRVAEQQERHAPMMPDQARRIRGSTHAYATSTTSVKTMMQRVAKTTTPCVVGRSKLLIAVIASFPNPGSP